MKIFLSNRERIAGLFIVATVLLVVTFFVGAAVRNKWLAPRTHFHTEVKRGDGLRAGSPVLLSGVEVGEIGNLVIRGPGEVDVEIVVFSVHAPLVQEGTRAVVRRLLGIGEKRIHLTPPGGKSPPLPPGSLLAAVEQTDIPEALAELDLGSYLGTMNRAMTAMERLLTRFEEKDRLERLVLALDRLGPLVEKVDTLLDEVHQPLAAILKNPSLPEAITAANELLRDPLLHETLAGAATVLNDPATRRFVHGGADALEATRMNRLLNQGETLVTRLDALTAEKGAVTNILVSADKLLANDRLERLVGAVERLGDEKKLSRILDNVAILAEQMGKIGPEIPGLTRELTVTLREAVVVLRALQKTWMLEGKSADARKELDDSKELRSDPPPKPATP